MEITKGKYYYVDDFSHSICRARYTGNKDKVGTYTFSYRRNDKNMFEDWWFHEDDIVCNAESKILNYLYNIKVD